MTQTPRPSSRAIARITCPDCGLDQPLSMDCAGCRKSFSLDELNAARQGGSSATSPAAAPAASTAAPGKVPPPPPAPVAPSAPSASAPPADASGGGSVFADQPVFRDEPASNSAGAVADASGGDQVFGGEPASGTDGEPEFGNIYDPSKAIHRKASASRYSVGGQADLSAGDLVQEAIHGTFANFLPVGIVTVLVSIPALLYIVYFVGSVEAGITSEELDVGNMLFHLGGLLVVTVLCQLLGSAALTHVVGCWLRDETVVLTDSIGVALRSLVVLVPMLVVQGIGLVFGFLLLIIPGFILAIGWSVSAPVAVVERLGVMESLGRSWRLTSGNRLAIFFAFLILNVLSNVTEWGVGLVAPETGALAASLTLTVVFSALQAVLVALIYFKLRAADAGVPIDQVPLTPPAGAY